MWREEHLYLYKQSPPMLSKESQETHWLSRMNLSKIVSGTLEEGIGLAFTFPWEGILGTES